MSQVIVKQKYCTYTEYRITDKFILWSSQGYHEKYKILSFSFNFIMFPLK